MRIETQVDICARVERVWALTEDVEKWPSLTPTITSVERRDDGPLRVGSTARIVQPRQRPKVWTVTAIDRPHFFRWQTKVLTITMAGTHELEATPEGCRNTLGVELSGFGSKLMARLVGRRLKEAIEAENQGFKKAAEASNVVP